MTVHCSSTKGTGVHYAWYQKTQHKDVLLHHSSDLHLHCSTVDRDSDYYCIVSNDISSQGSDILSVQVLMPADSSCIYVINMQGKNRCDVVFSPINTSVRIGNTFYEASVYNVLYIP